MFLEHLFMYKNNMFSLFVAAFSWFAFCEYIIASANMAFHVTVILDFPTEQIIIAKDVAKNQLATCKID